MSFKSYTLGDIASNTSRRFDFNNKEQVFFINTGDILDGHFLVDKKSSSARLPGQAKKAIQKGDILYSEIRPGNKRHLLVDINVDDYVVSTKFMVITCNQDIVIPEYLYLILTSKQCEADFKAIADSRSGTFPQITFDAIAHYPIELPPLVQQRAMVEFIKSITGKLELNTQTNQTLEAMAQAIFKSWFVDFDPVKAKMQGKQPEV
ncbi:restriction endonuclease subunit S [Salinivibrio sp. PR5]|uniref:restriction endonuclease subunit S n=1 Tax=Salinivibrio sp. PR5 TaxID=1909484 RepID=UPI00098B5072|nr:restriction endonuclease subunit S [Salinivibrio sp. PR5]